MLLAAAAATCICGHAYAGSKAVFGGAFANQLLDAKTAVGQDGLLRFIFDYNAGSGGVSTYSGSALWIVDPNGGLVASGNPTIPASVGSFFFNTLNGAKLFSFERSNTVLFAQPSGNTTVLLIYGFSTKGATSFGTWTYNSAGNLIAAAGPYGPFSNTTLQNVFFDSNGKIVVKWASSPGPNRSFAGWVLNEFGSLISATNYYAFGPGLGKIRVNASGQQIWPFSFPASGGNYTTTIWTFNSSGSALVNAQSYGPF